MSAPYSGSTLLAMLLATHPQVGTLGERGHFHRKLLAEPVVGSPTCSCGRLFVDCEFWLAVRAEVAHQVPSRWLRAGFSTFQLVRRPRRLRGWLDALCLRYAVDDRLARLPFSLRGRFAALQAANAALVAAVLKIGEATVFLDTSKVVSHAVYLDRTPGLQVRAVHLLRDGRAQVHSILGHHQERDVARASRQWAAQVGQQARVLTRAGIPTLTVRYEELCADPRGTAGEVLSFAGLDPEQATMQLRPAEQHIMGNPMRLADAAEIVDKQRWRREMSPAERQVFEQVAGAYNRTLGYGD